MSTFVDFKERTWTIPHWDPFLIADVKQETGVSLYELPQKLGEVDALFQNTPLFAHVLWVLVRGQNGVTVDRDFGSGLLGGSVLQKAAEAFWEELLFFSPPDLQVLLAKGMQQAKQLQSEALPQAEQLITMNLRKLFGKSLESAGSTRKEKRSAG